MTQSLPRRVAVKIGSNVLTRPDGTLDITRMSAIVDQVAQLRAASVEVILITSGAVAAGRSELPEAASHRLDPVSARQLFSAVGQAKLIDRYFQLFREHHITCGQVLTTKENFATRHHYLNQHNCMDVMLREGVIPVVNENDTVSVTELMFTDNDELSGLIAMMMNCDRLVILSNIDGVFTGNPADPDSRLIERVAPGRSLARYISSAKSGLGRGGMTTKHSMARKVSDAGIEVIIANGKRDGILPALLLGAEPAAPATRFEPNPHPTSSVKRWIASSGSFAKGSVTLNADAAATLIHRPGTSVLPVGITAVEGDFAAGDLIRVLSPEGDVVAWGRTASDAAAVTAAAGREGARPVIHADYIYVNDPSALHKD